jgi:hypothetical protein
MVVKVWIMIWIVTLYSHVGGEYHYGGTCCQHLQVRIDRSSV